MLRSRTGRSRRWFGIASAAVAVGSGFLACGGSTSQGVRPTTGIVLRAEALTAGRGCGTAPTQLYKYVVVVLGYRGGGAPESDPASYDRPVTSNVFDCFADGVFVELPVTDGNAAFRLEVYAYNEASYEASRGAIAIAHENTSALRETGPTWTTVCTATQQPEVESLAVCAPLAPGLAGLGQDGGAPHPVTRIRLETTSFRLPDGGIAACEAEEPDGGADASAGDADAGDADAGETDAGETDAGETDAGETDAGETDAGETDAGETDAGETGGFTTVRVRYRTRESVGPTVDVRCPAPFVAEVPAEPRRYEIDVGLMGSDGVPVATIPCSVTSAPGTTATVACP